MLFIEKCYDLIDDIIKYNQNYENFISKEDINNN
jgi:hypothetical protein